jgi:hypothetical protein
VLPVLFTGKSVPSSHTIQLYHGAYGARARATGTGVRARCCYSDVLVGNSTVEGAKLLIIILIVNTATIVMGHSLINCSCSTSTSRYLVLALLK